MSIQEFSLPDVGEGLTEADIVSWAVKPGDTVALNQVICEIETAKSLVELPSPFEGVVEELVAKVGETVPVGKVIMRVDIASDTSGDRAAAQATSGSKSGDAGNSSETGAVLVGYGSRGAVKSRRAKKSAAAVAPLATNKSAAKKPLDSEKVSKREVLAKPPVRKLAKDMGVDLATVNPTGVHGQVTREDLYQAAKQPVLSRVSGNGVSLGEDEVIPVKGVRKMVAQAMVKSKFTAPHVSVFVDVDVTRTMEFVARLKKSPDFAGIKVSPLLIMAKAMIWAVRRNPGVNVTWTDEAIYKHSFVNLGIAAATPRGLIVPNIKNAHEMSLAELAEAIENLTLRAREGVTQPAEMAGGTITITNIGIFGVDFGTPILNPGEVAIIALGTIKEKPWVVDGEVRPRLVTTVGGSFDHRAVDGDVMSKFVADVAAVLEEPALLIDQR